MLTLVNPSQDITGATDTAAINAALVLDDVVLAAGAQYYVRAAAINGGAVAIPPGRTLQGATAENKSKIFLAGTLATSGSGTIVSELGNGLAKNITLKNVSMDGGRPRVVYSALSALLSFTSGTNVITFTSSLPTPWVTYGFTTGMTIQVGGTASNNGTYTITSVGTSTITVDGTLTTEAGIIGMYVLVLEAGRNNCFGGGVCIGFSGHNDYGSNNITVTDCDFRNGGSATMVINSIDGITFTRITTDADRFPAQPSHGNDFDSVAIDKPCKNVVWVDSVLDSYGNEALKYENTEGATHTRCTFNNYISILQDTNSVYSDLKDISFVDSTFNSFVGLALLKRQHIPGRNHTIYNPTMGLTLTSAGVSTGETVGVTITAASGTPFATTIFDGNGPVGCLITSTTGFINGAALVTARISDTVVTATVINKFASSAVAGNNWEFSETNNSGQGNVSFTNCNFIGDDAWIKGADNSGVNYGAVTISGCTFTGRNSHFFPTAYTGFVPTVTGCTGIKSVPTLWVCNASKYNQNIINVGGGGGQVGGSMAKSMGASTATATIAVFASTSFDGYNYSNAKITLVDDIYDSSGFFSGWNTGNINIPFSIESETKYGAILDGINVASSPAFAFNGTNTRLVSFSGFYIKNFTGGTSSRGLTFNAATAVGRVYDNYFYNCSCTANGGSGVRVQVAQSALIENNIFDSITTSGAGNGVCILANYVGTVIRGNLVKNCSAPGTSSSMFYLQANAAGETWATGNVFVNNTGVGNIGIGVSTSQAGSIFNIYNNSSYHPNAIAANFDYSFFQGAAGVTVNFFNNIGYSPTMTLNVSKTTNGTFNYADNCTRVTVSAAGGTNNNLGGNILTDPAFTSLTTLIIDKNSPCYGTGYAPVSSAQAMIRDFSLRPFRSTFSMGAYEITTAGYQATIRSNATTRVQRQIVN